LKAGKGFYLAKLPGTRYARRLLYNIEHYNRVIGGINQKSAEEAREIYKDIVRPISTSRTA